MPKWPILAQPALGPYTPYSLHVEPEMGSPDLSFFLTIHLTYFLLTIFTLVCPATLFPALCFYPWSQSFPWVLWFPLWCRNEWLGGNCWKIQPSLHFMDSTSIGTEIIFLMSLSRARDKEHLVVTGPHWGVIISKLGIRVFPPLDVREVWKRTIMPNGFLMVK